MAVVSPLRECFRKSIWSWVGHAMAIYPASPPCQQPAFENRCQYSWLRQMSSFAWRTFLRYRRFQLRSRRQCFDRRSQKPKSKVSLFDRLVFFLPLWDESQKVAIASFSLSSVHWDQRGQIQCRSFSLDLKKEVNSDCWEECLSYPHLKLSSETLLLTLCRLRSRTACLFLPEQTRPDKKRLRLSSSKSTIEKTTPFKNRQSN